MIVDGASRVSTKLNDVNIDELMKKAINNTLRKKGAGKGDLDVAMSAKEVAEYGYKALISCEHLKFSNWFASLFIV